MCKKNVLSTFINSLDKEHAPTQIGTENSKVHIKTQLLNSNYN